MPLLSVKNKILEAYNRNLTSFSRAESSLLPKSGSLWIFMSSCNLFLINTRRNCVSNKKWLRGRNKSIGLVSSQVFTCILSVQTFYLILVIRVRPAGGKSLSQLGRELNSNWSKFDRYHWAEPLIDLFCILPWCLALGSLAHALKTSRQALRKYLS